MNDCATQVTITLIYITCEKLSSSFFHHALHQRTTHAQLGYFHNGRTRQKPEKVMFVDIIRTIPDFLTTVHLCSSVRRCVKVDCKTGNRDVLKSKLCRNLQWTRLKCVAFCTAVKKSKQNWGFWGDNMPKISSLIQWTLNFSRWTWHSRLF